MSSILLKEVIELVEPKKRNDVNWWCEDYLDEESGEDDVALP